MHGTRIVSSAIKNIVSQPLNEDSRIFAKNCARPRIKKYSVPRAFVAGRVIEFAVISRRDSSCPYVCTYTYVCMCVFLFSLFMHTFYIYTDERFRRCFGTVLNSSLCVCAINAFYNILYSSNSI